MDLPDRMVVPIHAPTDLVLFPGSSIRIEDAALALVVDRASRAYPTSLGRLRRLVGVVLEGRTIGTVAEVAFEELVPRRFLLRGLARIRVDAEGAEVLAEPPGPTWNEHPLSELARRLDPLASEATWLGEGVDQIARLLDPELDELQDLLETLDPMDRATKAYAIATR